MRRMKALILAVLLAAVVPSVVLADGGPKNLTQSNRAAITAKIEDLQHTELMRVTRGRLKSNPVIFPFHTIYQTVLQQNDMLIRNQTDAFAGTLARLEKTFTLYKTETETTEGKAAEDYFRRELTRLYDISGPVSESKSFMDVWLALQSSIYGMEALPERAALALNAIRWLSKKSQDETISAKNYGRIQDVMKKWEPAADIFKMDTSLRELSAEYSKVFLAISEETNSAGQIEESREEQ